MNDHLWPFVASDATNAISVPFTSCDSCFCGSVEHMPNGMLRGVPPRLD
jgi:hypothetical protein